jgi:integrase/recombinase XerD
VSSLAKHLSSFLREHLPRERRASTHTCDTYAYSYQLLASFAAGKLKVRPSQIEIEDIDSSLVLAFLEYVEGTRGNVARTRNVRLAAIKAFFRYLEHRHVAYLDQSRQIHAIPMKKVDEGLIDYLTRDELLALLNAPNNRTPSGLRDRAMLHLAFAAGLRVSELVSIRADELDRRRLDTIHVMGKGRRERILPLWKETRDILRAWLAARPSNGDQELFLNAKGKAMSRFGFAYIVSKHVAKAAEKQPSLLKKRISPHALRHTCAMHTLRATRDIRKVSLWLGHATLQSTEIYLRADPTEKLEALMTMAPPGLERGHFKAPDKLLSMLSDVRSSKNYVE